MPTNKTCSLCKQNLLLIPEVFRPNKYHKHGYYSKCRKCECLTAKIAYAKNGRKTPYPGKKKICLLKLNPQERRELRALAGNVRKKRNIKISPVKRLHTNMGIGISKALKGQKRGRSWTRLVNYTIDELKHHLEMKFKQGMTWENYGKYGWHVDHVIPRSAFDTQHYDEQQFKECWSLENLQPLWASENHKKGALLPNGKRHR